MTDIRLGPGAEFDLIRRLRARWGALAPDLGDDAALVDVPRGEHLLVSTDAAIEGVHFRREWIAVQEIGYRAVTAALSDLAAMAASPLGVLVALDLPDDAGAVVDQLADGIGDAVRAAGTVIRGGNVARAPALGITTTVLGSAFAPLRRSGGRPGDLLYLTGALGGPHAALRSFASHGSAPQGLRQRFARPVARIAEARWLAARGAIAAIDISDGLTSDARHLAAASGVRVEIHADRVPVYDGATLDDALAGGEEFELLVAARTPLPEREFVSRFALPLTAVGRLEAGEPDVLLERRGERVAASRGYDHFSR